MKNVFLVACLLCSMQKLSAQTWTSIGPTQMAASPYTLYSYKIAQVNASADYYGTILEVSVQADGNYFNAQGTFQIRIDKWTGTTDRFDGLEIICLSGNPLVANFFIYKDALWVQSKYQWGNIFYRTIGGFGASPLTTSPFSQTTTTPTGYLQLISGYGMKFDFDNNQFYKLPYKDVAGNSIFDGKVGIGTSAPNNKLSLDVGSTRDGIAITSDGNTAAYSDINFFVKTLSSIPANNVHNWTISHRKDGYFSGSAASSLEFYGVIPGGQYYAPLVFKSDGDVVLASPYGANLKRSGNVGVGTINPIEKLSVNGTILAKKVRVSQAAVDWPDYVFDSSYQLPSLESVSSFIRINKHLPEIPSASTIEKDGHDLGEVQKLLLKKVEELTLYLMEQEKNMKALREENATIIKLNEALVKQLNNK